MKVQEIIQKHSFDDIFSSFNHLFLVNSGHELLSTEIEQWRNIYEKLQLLGDEKKSSHYIRLIDRWEKCSPYVDMNCHICDQEGLLCPVADYSDISELLSMDVIVDDDVFILESELAAGLFWEITYIDKDLKMVK